VSKRSDADNQRIVLRRWRRSPALFAQDIWGITFRDKQREVLDAFGEGNRETWKTAWRGFRGCSKTATEAILALWHPTVYHDSVVVTTSGTWRQVKEMQWREIGKWYRRAPPAAKKIFGEEPLTTQWNHRPDAFAIGVSCKDPGNIEGFHARHVLVIVDEAKVVPDSVFRATFGYEQSAETVRMFCASAAGRNIGFFHDRFHTEGWNGVHSDGEESPDCSPEWIAMMKQELGEDSPYYRAQVKAEFYEEDERTLVPAHALDLARKGGGDDLTPGGEKAMGVDVGAGGDLSSLCARHGPHFFHASTLKREDTTETYGAALDVHRDHKLDRITVDAAGVGKGVSDLLAKEKGLYVEKYFAGGRARDPERFNMRRAEDAYGLRMRFVEGQADCHELPESWWIRFAAQANSIRISRNPRGQYELESKAAYKSRMSEERGPEFARSPDELDSAVMCCAAPKRPPPSKAVAFSTKRKR